MKTVLIIGMGRFGHHLASNMISLGNEVMIVDKDESRLEDLTKLISNIKIGDCTNEEVLRSLGVGNFDLCFVCIGSNFQSSLEITSLVKELGGIPFLTDCNTLYPGSRKNAIERTCRWRPDLIETARLTPEERAYAQEILDASYSQSEE